MTTRLYDYQQQGVADIRRAMRTEKRVLYQLPTGGGKTVVFSHIANAVRAKGKRVLALVHRRELLSQASEHFTKEGIGHSVIAPGYTFYPQTPVQIASVDTLIRRKDLGWEPDLIIIDECHHVVPGNKWGSTMDRWPNAYVLGVTATPRRLDGKSLGDSFGALVPGPSMLDLIGMGRLSKYELIGAKLITTEGSHIRMGDFVAKDIEEINNMTAVIGDTVATFKARGKLPALVFGSSLKAAESLAERFSDAGYRSACLSFKTPKIEREKILRGLETGSTEILTSFDTVSEGLDIPRCATVVLCHASKSETKFLQQVGRGLRTARGKDAAIVIDHGANYMRHGLPDDDRDWSLTGKKASAREDEQAAAIKTCPKCLRAHKAAPVCPYCGHVYEIKPREEIEQIDGQLEVIDLEAHRNARKAEQRSASTYEDLVELGKSRGYKSPAGWARHVMKSRELRGRTRQGRL